MKPDSLSLDYRVIYQIIEPGSRVLDLGCGTGDLIHLLEKEKNARVQGIELDDTAIYKCVEKGLSVFHSDIDSGLSEYPDKSFDYVILNQSLQQIKHVDIVLTDALRVGKQVIVGFPNFAFYKGRLQIFFQGRTPVIGALPYQWYETPNLHFLSISDFYHYCRKRNIKIESAFFTRGNKFIGLLPNWFAEIGIFLIS